MSSASAGILGRAAAAPIRTCRTTRIARSNANLVVDALARHGFADARRRGTAGSGAGHTPARRVQSRQEEWRT